MVAKRLFDLLGSALALLLLAPLLLVVAAWIKVDTPGPVFYRQERVGRHGVPFRIHKFRTMRDGAGGLPLTVGADPRITRAGAWLRRTRVDELPQLLSVVRGDMSLVGPRPTLPDQAAAYDAFRRQRLLIRPGLTGLAQVHGNAAIPWDERILFDIAYVRSCSYLLDMGILARTAAVIVLGEQRMVRPFAGTKYARLVTPPEGYAD